ncbi:MAG: bifunctional nuclease family protein [Planctomycetes bacterium]|nr:bifunctional nuclease family protein [Planctomycetota bacterium]
MVQAELARIILNEADERQIIVLKECDGQRSFPIVIGIREAQAIHRGVHGLRHERPLTHDLMLSVFDTVGVRLERVIVNDLRDGTFFARLIVVRDGETYDIDSRPSDAIALAVQRETPIYVEEKVFDEACRFDI